MAKYKAERNHYNVRTYGYQPGSDYVAKSTYHSNFSEAKREAKKQRNYFTNFDDEYLFYTEIDQLKGPLKYKTYKRKR